MRHLIETTSFHNNRGDLCGLCDGTDEHDHQQMKCLKCGAIGLAENMEKHECSRITEAALLIANVGQQYESSPDRSVLWIHGNRWTLAINNSTRSTRACHVVVADIPFGSIAVWDGPKLAGVFSANEGYLNNADEFINDMKELLEKDTA